MMREYPWISFSPWLNEFHMSKKKPHEFAKMEKWMNKKTTNVFDLHNSCGFWHHIIYWKFSSKKIAPLMLPTPPFAAVLEHLGNDGYRNRGGELFRLHPFCSSIDCLGWCNFWVKGSRDTAVCNNPWAFRYRQLNKSNCVTFMVTAI